MSLAGVGSEFVYVVALFSGPGAGALSDDVSGSFALAGTLVVGAVGLEGVLFVDGVAVMFVAICLTPVEIMSYLPVVRALLMFRLGDESGRGDLGTLKTVYSGVGSLGPMYIESAVSAWVYVSSFSIFVVCLLVG